MRKNVTSLLDALAIVLTLDAPAFAWPNHIQVQLHPVGVSGVAGLVNLTALHQGGTRITLVSFGLHPGNEYISLYYDNHVCALEPYSLDDVIGGIYTANPGGVG